MQWFAERFSGWIIRIGPDAHQRPDPYLWALPLSDEGEFVGVSTKRLNSEAVRVATDAANSLGFEAPHWLHKENLIMTKKVKIPHATNAFKPDGRPNYHAIIDTIHLVKEQDEGGHYVITGSADQKENPDGSADLTFKLHRAPKDPNAPAA